MKLMKSLLICPIKKGISKKEDVAYLEVPGELSNSFDFNLDETGIITSIKLGLEKPVFVVGYPFKWIDPTRGKVEAFTLESVTVPTKEYPKWKGLENQFRARIEFLIAYDPVPGMRYLDLRDAQINAPVTREPPMLPGMSGCGIWISRLVSSKAGVRSAGPVLCGLQTGRVEKHLRATRIRFWLELVGKDYPDLATIIEKVKVNRL
jgi:hypothetical protein